MLVQDSLQSSAERYPDKTALVCGEQRLTYVQIERGANALARSLIELEVGRGDRVCIYLPNTVQAVLAVFGILKASAVFVVLNPTIKRDKLAYILNNCRAAALITSWTNAALAADLRTAVPSLGFVVLTGDYPEPAVSDGLFGWDALLDNQPDSPPPCRSIDQDLACLIYTSGSTGEPKGVVEGHNNVVFAMGSIITYLENTAEDVVINVLPLSFDYGLYQLLMVFRFGGTLVLENSFTHPGCILKRIETERVTGLPGVPTLFSILVQMEISCFNLSSLRYITNTAAALPEKHIVSLMEKFPTVKLYSMYGLTECKRTLYLPPEQLSKRPGSVGIAIPGTEVWLEDEEGNRLGPGGTGELVIRGSHVMRGYWEDEEATAKVYRSGPTPGERILYSGDLFSMDQEGYLYFVSRKDDILKCKGEKVSPKEVESCIYGIEGVVEAAVVGVPDPLLGQAIKAFVVARNPGITENQIKRHCSKNLESFTVPQFVEFRGSLPKTSSGKIAKRELV